MMGDCLERMKEIESGSVDMILTDPPYGTTACKWDSIIPLEPMWEQLKRIIKPNGAIVLTASQPFTTTLIASNMGDFKYELIWNKQKGTAPALAKIRPMPSHEQILIFSRNKEKIATYNPQYTQGKPYVDKRSKVKTRNQDDGHKLGYTGVFESVSDGRRYPLSVINISKTSVRGQHPSAKPVALMEYLLHTYTNESDTVLDFTMGSGSTGVAAKNLNRKFIGIELDENYFNIAKKRIEGE